MVVIDRKKGYETYKNRRRMSRKKLGITIISEVNDLVTKVTEFADFLNEKDYADLPYVYKALDEWELKNITLLTPPERNSFNALKQRIENLKNEFKIVA